MRATITLHYTLVADTVVPLSAIKRRVFAIPSGDKSDGFTNYTTPGWSIINDISRTQFQILPPDDGGEEGQRHSRQWITRELNFPY